MNFLFFFLSTSLPSLHAYQQNELAVSNYVVVAAYSINQESYAKRFVIELENDGHTAKYGLSRSKNLYFVYLSENQNFDEAISEMRKTRQNERFADAWVFVNKVGPPPASNVTSSQAQASEPEETNSERTKADANQSLDQESTSEKDIEENTEIEESEETSEKEESPAEERKEITALSQVGFKVNLYNAQNGSEVSGNVQLVDTERAKQLKTFKSGEVVNISNPNNGTGKLSVIVDNFGFRKQQKQINFFNPLSDTAKVDISYQEDALQLNFDLIRYSVGDFVVMYNVAFFKDAAIMRPESKFEVNSLIAMMEENRDMKIRIHGHVNGKHPGKIISKGEEPGYFKLSDLNKEGVGSAKELSKQRAKLIKNLLISEGIQENRMEIKAWGGKRMIHDKNSTQADENVRVEIEILED